MRARRAAARRRRPRSAALRGPGRRDHDHDLAARLGAGRVVAARAPQGRRAALPRAAWSARGRPPPRAAPSPAARSASVAASRGAALEQHQRRRDARELRDAGAPRGLPWRAEILRTRSGRSAGPRRSAPPAPPRRPGTAVTGKPASLRGAHQLVAGIGDQRRAGIGDERDRAAVGEPLPGSSAAPSRRCGRDRAMSGVAMP